MMMMMMTVLVMKMKMMLMVVNVAEQTFAELHVDLDSAAC